MRDVSRQGRTVLFVSHSMAAVAALCRTGILLDAGRVVVRGDAHRVIAAYQADRQVAHAANDLEHVVHEGTGKVRFMSVDVQSTDADGRPLDAAVTGCNILIAVGLRCSEPVQAANVAVIVCDSTGYRLIDANTAIKGEFLTMAPGECAFVGFALEDVLLKPGTYYVNLWAGRGGIEQMDGVEGAIAVTVHEDPSEQRHTETFPGPYQCRFTTSLRVATAVCDVSE
jgi:lipopolysaccharide transport system ATP-binding protein